MMILTLVKIAKNCQDNFLDNKYKRRLEISFEFFSKIRVMNKDIHFDVSHLPLV